MLLFGAIGCKSLAKTTARRAVVHAAAAETGAEKPAPVELRSAAERQRDLQAARYLRDCVKAGGRVPECVRGANELHAVSEPGYRADRDIQ